MNRLQRTIEGWTRANFAPLATPLFRALWTAALFSNLGAVVQTIGAAWMMTELSSSPQMVALVQTAATLPMVLLALPFGAVADTHDRRVVMLVAQIVGATSAVILAATVSTGHGGAWTLLGFTTLIGAAVALHQPAWQASLPDLVPREQLSAAVGLNVLAFNLARSTGPAVGGLMIATLGAQAVFFFNAVSFLGLILVLAFSRLPRQSPVVPHERLGPAMMSGIRFVVLSPALPAIYLRGAAFALCASAVLSLLPVIARSKLDGGPLVYGTLSGCLGLGSLTAAALSSGVRALLGSERLVISSTISFACAALLISQSEFLPLSAFASAAAGASWILVFTTTRTSIQLCSPKWVVGRAVGFGQMASFGCMAGGAAAWGALATHTTSSIAILVSAGLMGASCLLALVAPMPKPESAGTEPGKRPSPPSPVLNLEGLSGPIVVTIEYIVPADRADEFLSSMHELGRIRRRNGASRWRLQQDVDHPEYWLERIECATWNDHLRRLERYTQSEQDLFAAVHAYRIPEPPSLRRFVERHSRSGLVALQPDP